MVARPSHAARPRAAVVAVGTELVSGLRTDTNGAEIARTLTAAGFEVTAREVLPDDPEYLSSRLAALAGSFELVVVTGGLGPTHDDITRQAAARALGVGLTREEGIVRRLAPAVGRHHEPEAAEQVLSQADVLEGAQVLQPTTGTAPGQLVATGLGHLVLLPGPPHELRPMLAEALSLVPSVPRATPRILGFVDVPESDVQIAAQRVLASYSGIGLTVLARPSVIEVVLFDEGAGAEVLDEAATRVAGSLGDACHTDEGATLAQTVVRAASDLHVTISLAESCTGGMIAAELTSVPGASAVFCGCAVTYADRAKERLLGVDAETLRSHGAVSPETASQMAAGARMALGADIALAVTGIAGPGGGDAHKPVGTVWFAVDTAGGTSTTHRTFPGDRAVVRARATAIGLDLLRRAIMALADSTA